MDKHNGNCKGYSNARRLYIKDYNDKGKPTFIAYGTTCTSCDSFTRENYKLRATRREKRYSELLEPGDEKVRKMLEAQIGMSMNTFVNVSRAKDIIEKLHRRERKTMGGPAITREEQALRTRIKNLEKFYEKLSSRPGYPDLKGFGWDPELVKMFLLSRPTKIELSYVFSGLYPFTSTSMNWRKRRDLIGYVPNPDKPGIFKHDKQKYIELLKSEIKMRNEVMNHILKREEEPTPEPEIKDEDKGASIVIATKSNKKKRKIP